MKIENQKIIGKNLTWILRCPTESDAEELSEVRVKIDSETEFLDRESGEELLTKESFRNIIEGDLASETTLFLVAEVDGKIVGFTRCVGYQLSRYQHKASFGICILKDYWGSGIGSTLLEHIVLWADAMKFVKISLSVVQVNTAAIHLYQKFGFVEEGVLIKDRIHKDGNYYNTVIMGRIREA